MKQIARMFKGLGQAEAFAARLMNRYNSVKLIRSPIFTENGLCIWEVK